MQKHLIEYVAGINTINLAFLPMILGKNSRNHQYKNHKKHKKPKEATPLFVSFPEKSEKNHRKKRQIVERPSRKRGNTESYYRPESKIDEFVDEDFEYEWDDEDPEYYLYRLNQSPNLRFEINTGNAWNNFGTNANEVSNGDTDTCSEFRLCSNTVSANGGQCLFMSTNFFCDGCNPIDLTCELEKHVTIRAYHPTQKRLLWVYNSTSKHVMGFKKVEECMTVLAVNPTDFPDGGMDQGVQQCPKTQ